MQKWLLCFAKNQLALYIQLLNHRYIAGRAAFKSRSALGYFKSIRSFICENKPTSVIETNINTKNLKKVSNIV